MRPIKLIIKLYKKGLSSAAIALKVKCSKSTILRILKQNKVKMRSAMEANHKGSRWLDKRGYIRITPKKNEKHLKSKIGNTMLEHRLVMGKKLGRALTKNEYVHHKNGIKHDNRLSNLELWSNSQPPGQRIKDQIKWARKLLNEYGYKVIKK